VAVEPRQPQRSPGARRDFFAGEAALNSFVVVEGFKYPLGRQTAVSGEWQPGLFSKGGTSFPPFRNNGRCRLGRLPGVHCRMNTPGVLTKLLVYGLAATVDFSRVRARQHFPSDVSSAA